MSSTLSRLFIAAAICSVISCGGKKGQSDKTDTDTSAKDNPVISSGNGNADSSLVPVQQFIQKDLEKWMRSFTNFNIDSFRMTQKSEFRDNEAGEPDDPGQYYALYKPSLVYSPDSSQFVDLFSSGITLEKKGKKIIAIADVDQAVLLCNPKNKTWKQIAFFGPSAGIEEAVWISSSSFLLAGSVYNDEGKRTAFILLGDANSKTFSWFESNIIRPESSAYEASGLGKLKIDEWE